MNIFNFFSFSMHSRGFILVGNFFKLKFKHNIEINKFKLCHFNFRGLSEFTAVFFLDIKIDMQKRSTILKIN